MNLSPLPDVGWAALTAVFGGYALLVCAPLTILAEALVFRYLVHFSPYFRRALIDSFLANLISGIIGYLGLFLTGPGFLQLLAESLGPRFGEKIDYYASGNATYALVLLALVAALWLLSVVIEWPALAAFRPQWRKRALPAALVANLLSYSLLGMLAVFWYQGWFRG